MYSIYTNLNSSVEQDHECDRCVAAVVTSSATYLCCRSTTMAVNAAHMLGTKAEVRTVILPTSRLRDQKKNRNTHTSDTNTHNVQQNHTDRVAHTRTVRHCRGRTETETQTEMTTEESTHNAAASSYDDHPKTARHTATSHCLNTTLHASHRTA